MRRVRGAAVQYVEDLSGSFDFDIIGKSVPSAWKQEVLRQIKCKNHRHYACKVTQEARQPKVE